MSSFLDLSLTCICGGEADVDQHASISQSGPAGDRRIVATLWVHAYNHWRVCHILPQRTRLIPDRENTHFLFFPPMNLFFFYRDRYEDLQTHQTLTM